MGQTKSSSVDTRVFKSVQLQIIKQMENMPLSKMGL